MMRDPKRYSLLPRRSHADRLLWRDLGGIDAVLLVSQRDEDVAVPESLLMSAVHGENNVLLMLGQT